MNTRACYVHAGSNKSEKMAILFEEWIKCSEDWSSSDFVVRFRESTTHRQQGSRRRMDKGEIVEKYSRGRSKEEAEAVAMEIINNKINSAPHAIRPNPDCPLNSAMKQYLVWDESFESDTTDHVVESLFEAKDRSKGSKAKKDKKRKKRKASSSSSSSSKSSKSDSSDSSSADKKKKNARGLAKTKARRTKRLRRKLLAKRRRMLLKSLAQTHRVIARMMMMMVMPVPLEPPLQLWQRRRKNVRRRSKRKMNKQENARKQQ